MYFLSKFKFSPTNYLDCIPIQRQYINVEQLPTSIQQDTLKTTMGQSENQLSHTFHLSVNFKLCMSLVLFFSHSLSHATVCSGQGDFYITISHVPNLKAVRESRIFVALTCC